MDMRTILATFNAMTNESLTMAGGSHVPGDLDEASLTKNALYGQMKKTSNPSNYKPEVSNEPIDDFDTDDYDADHSEDDDASCWGCGQDWRENWSAEDLGPGEGYEQYGLDADDKICPDCAEELTGGELNEATVCENCGNPSAQCECVGLEEGKMCEVCSKTPCECKSGDRVEEDIMEAKKPNYYAIATAAIKKKYKLGKGKVDLTDAQTTEAHKLAKKLKKKAKKKTDESFHRELSDLRRLAECGPVMAVTAEPQKMDKMNVTTNVDSGSGQQTVTVSAEGDSAQELMRILQMAGIAVTPSLSQEVAMAENLANEPDPNALDTETVIRQGEDMHRVKGQYNPDRARDNSMTMVDEAVARLESKLRAKFIKEAQDSDDTCVTCTGSGWVGQGKNTEACPTCHGTGFRGLGGDGDDWDLKTLHKSNTENVSEERMPVWKQDASIRLTKKNYKNLVAAIKQVQDPIYKYDPTFAYYVDGPVPSNETEKQENLNKLRDKLDRLEAIAGTEKGSKSKELQKFLSGYAPKEREPVKYDRSKDPTVDDEGYPLGWSSVTDYDAEGYPVARYTGLKDISKSKKSNPYTDPDGYPKSTPYGWKPASERSEEDDWLH